MKIAYSDFWDDFNPETFLLTRAIKNVVDLQEVQKMDDANYLLFSCMGKKHWLAPNNVVKIFYTGENVVPDFNACDYGIGFDWLDFGNRYMRFPIYYHYGNICEKMERKHFQPFVEKIKAKKDFCSITVSNEERNPIFKDLFHKLSLYKKVDSGGRWNNNVGGAVQDKFAFDLTHKFSIVCENSSSPGYTTEKLVQALAANCIPIYWGDPAVEKVFNKKAFINVQDYSTIEEVVERVREIDENDDMYCSMLQEPALADEQYTKERQLEALHHFLSHIFSLPLEDARCRNRYCWGQRYVNNHRKAFFPSSSKESLWLRMKVRLYEIFYNNN